MALTHIGEADKWNRENFRETFGWANNLFTDSFMEPKQGARFPQ